MLFSDLLSLPFDQDTGVIDSSSIVAALPDTPLPVAQQVYADHGRKEEFQATYGALDIGSLEWRLLALPAETLCAATVNPQYRSWYDKVSTRASLFGSEGWKCIDIRRAVIEHWSKNGTWLIPPVMLSGVLVASTAELHLVEGHTRVGLLAGLRRHGVLPSSSLHAVWLGAASK